MGTDCGDEYCSDVQCPLECVLACDAGCQAFGELPWAPSPSFLPTNEYPLTTPYGQTLPTNYDQSAGGSLDLCYAQSPSNAYGQILPTSYDPSVGGSLAPYYDQIAETFNVCYDPSSQTWTRCTEVLPVAYCCSPDSILPAAFLEEVPKDYVCLWVVEIDPHSHFSCGMQFRSGNALQQHVEQVHCKEKGAVVCNWRACKRKGDPLKTKEKLKRHIFSHTGCKFRGIMS